MHVYTEGNNENAPLLVFLSGAGTTAPVYDFKPLYSLLSNDYRIAVVEKIGYGYSDIADVSRDIDTILSETREALRLAGENSPYILILHSMSGLEALRWAQLYPDEVVGIIGIDMAIPSVYMDNVIKISPFQITLLSVLARMGIPRFLPVSSISLTENEYEQAKLLFYRNTANITFSNETRSVLENARIAKNGGIPEIPMLLLVSNGEEISAEWVSYQKEFAEQNNAKIEYFNCGHYIHQYEPEKVADLCLEFVFEINE
jgi:pimeloyl-ACP methyl ester carboxylesterase